MSATVVSLPPRTGDETVDFLRRMASMVSGKNGEMLLKAAATIESLTQRATSTEALYEQQRDESTRNAELRQVAELASDALLKQLETVRKQLTEVTTAAATERVKFEAERVRLTGLMRLAETKLTGMTAELDALKASVDALNETAISVPIEVLRLARSQFDFLSDGFARNGDVISQTMSEIGACAINQALSGNKPA
jgi:hypothetical protein